MRSPDQVPLQVLPQDICVAALHTRGHGLADKWKSLVPVEAAQLDDLAVQLKPVVGKLRLAKSEPTAVLINHCSSLQKPRIHGVQAGLGEFPQPDARQFL